MDWMRADILAALWALPRSSVLHDEDGRSKAELERQKELTVESGFGFWEESAQVECGTDAILQCGGCRVDDGHGMMHGVVVLASGQMHT